MSARREARPGMSTGAGYKLNLRETSSSLPGLAAALTRKRWALGLIRRAPYPPSYGSAAWLALADNAPAKVSAVVVAAECWATDRDNLAENLRRELDETRWVGKQLEDAEYLAAYRAHRQRWRSTPFLDPRLSQVERVADARRPRPGDHPGRGPS
jgi:hypothetical protein